MDFYQALRRISSMRGVSSEIFDSTISSSYVSRLEKNFEALSCLRLLQNIGSGLQASEIASHVDL